MRSPLFRRCTRLIPPGILGSFFLALPAAAQPAVAPASSDPAAEAARRLKKIERNGYRVVDDCHSTFSTYRRERFEPAIAQLGARLERGYVVEPLGELRKKGEQVTLWRISFNDCGDDVLATLTMKDGKVTAFSVN